MADLHLTIVKFDEELTLRLCTHEGDVKRKFVMSADEFEVLKVQLHKEHEIDITRAILESAFPGDDEDDDLPLCEEGL